MALKCLFHIMALLKTRHSYGKSQLSDYLGGSRALILSELPTLRCILRQGLLFQERKILSEYKSSNSIMQTLITVKELSSKMAETVISQWLRANVEFSPPVVITAKQLEVKLKGFWETARDIAHKRITKKKQIESFEQKLDKILDITKCRCQILSCKDFDCKQNCRKCKNCNRCGECVKCLEFIECKQGCHIKCSCQKEQKIPILDLAFLDSQRRKTGERGNVLIAATVDRL